ncbi:TBC1 domain family member 20 isoform X1 [Latimeria chalumnae]|uniref:TBC1 domain family member 20 n=1 Tax=Latimeria chalumnae TaxID=7897 RepID=H3A6H4_LATCH|nr:PREDICTED: TBC1 domain family member 20-like isoform X1 [Latimeria chalumnae]XP_006011091.1 PREDICTED: TBC1 domain family member 20-like isoform X1 [Latimeria chalumnae]|eukprot:XP_006011090.1 PREDICTED: TBC1 domain family member 20-like isoform X1 [Latimeria chalumnae]
MSGRKGRRFSTSSQNGSYLQSPSPAAGIKPAEMESRKKRKLVEIHQALISDPVDIQALQRAAVSEGGLLTDEIRRKVWPKLLSVNVYCLPPKPVKEVRRNHKDFQQVLLDVHRSFRRFPKGMRCEQREVLQEQLTDVILDVLRRNPQLHYYQGYHDIAVTFLLVVGKRMTVALLEKLSTHHLRDFMDPTMDSTKHILNFLMPILERVSTPLHNFLQRSEVGTIFALSWLITWYGHVLSDFRHVLRLYDFFLTSHPLMAVYFAAVIVLHREEEVLHCDCDVASVHHLLSQIPQDLPYEELITHADDLFRRYPPVELAKQAALQQRKSIAISSFRDLQLATLHQRPDSVLRRQLQERPLHDPSEVKNSVTTATNQLVKMAVWGLSATLGAAALAVAQTAMEWAPEFLFQLF